MDVKPGSERRLSAEELMLLMLLNCGAGEKLLRVPLTARRLNQSILKEINPEYSLEGLMLKVKLQYFGHLMQRANSLEKTVMLGKTEGKRRRRWQRMRWLDSVTDSMDMNLSKFQEMEGDRGGSFATVMSLQRWTQLATEELQHMKHSYLYEKRFYVVETYTWKRDNIVEK